MVVIWCCFTPGTSHLVGDLRLLDPQEFDDWVSLVLDSSVVACLGGFSSPYPHSLVVGAAKHGLAKICFAWTVVLAVSG